MIRTVPSLLIRRVVWLAPLVLAFAACDSHTNPSTQTLTVSTTTTPTSSGNSGGATGGSLTFSAAQVVLRKVELAPVGTSCMAEVEDSVIVGMNEDERAHDDGDHEGDNDGDHDVDNDEGCEELKVGPLTVNLPLDTTTKLILDALVPAGTYRGVKAKLDAATVSGVFTDTAGGTHPFTFTSTGTATIRIKLATPITVGPTTSNVTITIDVASWFKNANGAVLNPADPANAALINRNIRRSFRAFCDNNHNGVDDDHDGDHGHDGGHDH